MTGKVTLSPRGLAVARRPPFPGEALGTRRSDERTGLRLAPQAALVLGLTASV